MERTKIEGTLPVAIHLVAEQQPLKLKKSGDDSVKWY